LRLPLHPATDAREISRLEVAAPVAAPVHAMPHALAGRRVLLAEDGEDNQRLISVLLRAAGADVTVVSNGRQALDAIEWASAGGAPFDLLLSDMQMPEMDGYSLATALRAMGNPIPIVALTAHAMADDRRKCLDAGCDDYATKPIDRQALIATCARRISTVDVFPTLEVTRPAPTESADLPDRLISELADDPELGPLVAAFAEQLGTRVQAIAEHLDRNDTQAASRLAHQLKGAAGSYGFPSVGDLARQLELALAQPSTDDRARLLTQLTQHAAAARRGVGGAPSAFASASAPEAAA
jgi:CheY-like chemotaxis protein